MPRPPACGPAPFSGTADRMLDVAEGLVQTRGFNGFSYADVSTSLGITTASLHYHFATKAQLGRALVERYTARFGQALAEIETRRRAAPARLRAYGRLYVGVLARDRICLCGMLAAEISTLPRPMQRAVRAFFDANEHWLGAVLERGRRAGELEFDGSARDAARTCTSMLEGAMLLARSYRDPGRLATVARRMVDGFARPRRRPAAPRRPHSRA